MGVRDQHDGHQKARGSSRGRGGGWNKEASRSVWRDFNDVRQNFPDADQYKSLLIFNIRHNYYRLIVKVDYRAKLLMVKEFITHNEYMRGGWKKWAR